MSSEPLQEPLQYLKGVGPRRAADLRHAGLTTVEDLLYRFPIRYDPLYWGAVFPLGMYTVATWQMARIDTSAVPPAGQGQMNVIGRDERLESLAWIFSASRSSQRSQTFRRWGWSARRCRASRPVNS